MIVVVIGIVIVVVIGIVIAIGLFAAGTMPVLVANRA